MRQLVDLLRAVVKDGLPLGQQRQLLQLGVGVGDVSSDAARDLHEVGRLPRKLAVLTASAASWGTAIIKQNYSVLLGTSSLNLTKSTREHHLKAL